MSDIAIKVENLSKRYRIGLEEELPDTLVGALTQAVKRPLRNWRRLRKLTHFDDERPMTNDHPTPSDSESSSFVLRRSSGSEASPSDTLWALRDVSFEVQRGEVVGIIGRNGAGKSTLLKILARITHPTSGRAVINGRVGSLLEVGTGFHPELTGRENIYMNGTLLGMTKAEVERKFDEIVDFSGVEKFIDTPVKRYSSGMRVRLAFSVAAHLDPEILLIDEVLAVGDAGFQKKCLGKMEDVTGEGRTVLFVSHNMGSILELCDRAIFLDKGRLILQGNVDHVVTKYRDSFITNRVEGNEAANKKVAFGNVLIGEPVDFVVKAGEPTQIRSSIRINMPASRFSLFCIVDDETGRKVIHSRVESSQFKTVNAKFQEYEISVHLPPLWLNAGVYTVYFKVLIYGNFRKSGRFFSDKVPFTVVGEANRASALLNPTVSWSLENETLKEPIC